VAFEPFPPTYHLLRLNVNGIENIEIRETALSSDCDKGVMARYRQFHSGSASLLDSDLKRNVGERFIVTKSTLDSELCNQGIQPDIIKIDVEGHEMDVLKGSNETLRSTSVVQFEMGGTNIDTRVFFQDFFYFFRERGFEIRRLTPRGLRPVRSYSELDEAFVATNYIALRVGN